MTETRGDRIRELGDKARELSKLAEHPSWALLRQELERVKEAHVKRYAQRLLSRGIDAPPFDQRQVDYQRGFFAGADWILNNPEQAEATLAIALRQEEERV